MKRRTLILYVAHRSGLLGGSTTFGSIFEREGLSSCATAAWVAALSKASIMAEVRLVRSSRELDWF